MEEYVEDQKDFWFPKNNKSIKQLGEMTTQEQIQVIELGLMTKVISIEAAKRIVNGENELNKDNMANMYQTQINELEANNKEKDRRIAQIQQRHLNDRENDRQEIRKKQTVQSSALSNERLFKNCPETISVNVKKYA